MISSNTLRRRKKKISLEREALLKSTYEKINPDFPEDLKFAVELAQEKGASSWLNVLPIQDHGFSLHKSDFRDTLALRLGWTPLDLYHPIVPVGKISQ